MLSAIIALAVLAIIFGLALGYAAVRFKVVGDPLVEKIDSLLPQTQCGQCTFPGCRPYAEAIARGEADINQCPPGGETTIVALADLLGRDPKPLNPENGEEKPKRVAVIDEQVCIGCTLCIQACPVDAILGAAKQMHTVIAQECTGCDLCLPPCPVDCIEMVEIKPTLATWKWDFPQSLPEDLASLAHRVEQTPASTPSPTNAATGAADTTASTVATNAAANAATNKAKNVVTNAATKTPETTKAASGGER